jgi:hypothetical protein
MTKKGKKPEIKPNNGTQRKELYSDRISFEKYKTLIPITKIIFGIKEETVRPYKDETSNCLRRSGILSKFIFNTRIAVTNPKLKIQNK